MAGFHKIKYEDMNTKINNETVHEAQPAIAQPLVSGSETLETKLELVEISEGVIFQFVYIPKGYKLKSYTLENHKTHYLGKLNSFNRIKLLDKWKKDNGCLVTAFTKVLEARGWDFNKFPNPVATVAIHCH